MKEYSIILADPPWAYKVWAKKGVGRTAESHYPTMHIEDIRALPVGKLAAKDCALFCGSQCQRFLKHFLSLKRGDLAIKQ